MEKINKYDVDYNCFFDPESHYWIEVNGDEARVGMSSLVQETSGSFVAIAFEDLNEISKGKSFGSAEAEKHVGPLISPVSGKVTEINQKVVENPRLINTDPHGEGWLIKMTLTNAAKELPELVYGKDQVERWFRSELKKFDEKGWIAQ